MTLVGKREMDGFTSSIGFNRGETSRRRKENDVRRGNSMVAGVACDEHFSTTASRFASVNGVWKISKDGPSFLSEVPNGSSYSLAAGIKPHRSIPVYGFW